MALADEALGADKPLAELVIEKPRIRQAWERGRFLRRLRDLAATPVTVSEAARKLELPNGHILREMLDSDPEVGDLWYQTRLEVFVEAKTALVTAAKAGNQAAIRAVETLLRDEERQASSCDLDHISTEQLCLISGKTRQTVHEWLKKGLPRNGDKTFNLADFVPWFEHHVEQRGGAGSVTAKLNPFQQKKVQLMEIELARQKGELLDRNQVLAGIAVRYQRMLSARTKIDDLAVRCHGKALEDVREQLEEFFEEMVRLQADDFDELRLPPAAEERFVECLQILQGE